MPRMTDRPADHEFRSSDQPYTCRICGQNIREHTLTDEVRAYLERPAEPTTDLTIEDGPGVLVDVRKLNDLIKRVKVSVEPALPKDEADEELRSRSVVRRLVAQGASDVLIEELETLRKENASLAERLRVVEAERDLRQAERDVNEIARQQSQGGWTEAEQLRTNWLEQAAAHGDALSECVKLRQQVASLEQDKQTLIYVDIKGLEAKVASLEAELARRDREAHVDDYPDEAGWRR